MPTTRVKRTRGRAIGAGGITEIDYTYFTFGAFFDAEDYELGKTKEDLKAFWNKHRQAIMDRYLEENRLKGNGWEGRRPWPFFEWDMTEPRLPVDMTLADNELYDHKKVGSRWA